MKFKVILTRIIAQSTCLEVEADDVNAAVIAAKRQHAEGLEWDDESVEYGTHEIHSGGKCQEFSFEEEG
jgi:hypothetical protein